MKSPTMRSRGRKASTTYSIGAMASTSASDQVRMAASSSTAPACDRNGAAAGGLAQQVERTGHGAVEMTALTDPNRPTKHC